MLKYFDEFIEKNEINKVIATLIILSLFYTIDNFLVNKHISTVLILIIMFLVLLHYIWKENFIIIITLIFLLTELIKII